MVLRGATARALAPPDLRLRRPQRAEEWELQKRIVKDLRAYLPAEVWFCCSLSGLRMPFAAVAVAKAGGMERGAPDLSFVFWASDDDATYFLELKTADGQLSEQQARLARCLGPKMRIARSFEDYREIVGGWLAQHSLRFLTDAESIKKGRLKL